MAKPTGAIEYSDAGLDVTNATEDDPARAFCSIVVPKQSTAFSADYRIKRAKLAVRPCVDMAGSTMRVKIYNGQSMICDFAIDGPSSDWHAAQTDDREPDVSLASEYLGSDVDVEFVELKIVAWNSNSSFSARLMGIHVRAELGYGDSSAWGVHSCNTATEANRLYRPNRAFTAYHLSRLLAGTANALAKSSQNEQYVQLYGDHPV